MEPEIILVRAGGANSRQIVDETAGTIDVGIVSLTVPSEDPVTVIVDIVGGTATRNADYIFNVPPIVFAPGDTSGRLIQATILDDNLRESEETFVFGVVSPSPSNTLEVVIRDDDTVKLSVSDVTVREGGTASFILTLDKAPKTPIQVQYSTSTDTASSSDFSSTSGTVTFQTGQTQAIVNVPITRDFVAEGDETFSLTVTPISSGVPVLKGTGNATILDEGGVVILPSNPTSEDSPTIGGSGNDYFFGNGNNNFIRGRAGNDSFYGFAGNDTIYGDAGDDILNGGLGADKFFFDSGRAFRTADFGVDTLQDFSQSQGDKIILSKRSFTALTSPVGGSLVSSDFGEVSAFGDAAVTAAGNSSAIIVINRATGDLYYNANGAAAGLGSGALFAKIPTAVLGFSRSDILVIT
jgi:Calx-beta domain/RTX calcium-binding nonapeptide repeat (4 copies)